MGDTIIVRKSLRPINANFIQVIFSLSVKKHLSKCRTQPRSQCFLLPPYFDHDAFAHQALHVGLLDAPAINDQLHE